MTSPRALPRYLSGEEGLPVVMSGNQAIARGALEAGVRYATAYPGTPSTEILESLIPAAKPFGIRVDWSINEKVAFEAATAVSLLGLRAMVSMKHVGMNWVSDPLLAVNLSGVRGGLVLVVADDPGARSSHNEQDSRYYGVLAEIPVLEPAGPAEARDMVREAFVLSERLSLPVIVRSVARVSHAREAVILGKIAAEVSEPSFQRHSRWLVTGAGGNALRLHQQLHEKQREVAALAESSPFNHLYVPEGSRVGVVTAGVASAYVREALKAWNGGGGAVALLKLAFAHPVAPQVLLKMAAAVEQILVVEEGEAVIESQVRSLLSREGLSTRVLGRHDGIIPPTGELTTETVRKALAQVLPGGNETDAFPPPLPQLPRRDLSMCAGCPHRATFYALKRAIRPLGRDACLFCGDIGCYSFGSQPPFELVDVKYTMGASLGLACGFGTMQSDRRVFAVIGDSTFLHAGIPALANAVYHQARAVIVVLDNRTVGMTGQQPHPGTGERATGEKVRAIEIERLARALGVEFVEVVDPYDVKSTQEVLERAIAHPDLAVVVARRACALLASREAARAGRELQPYLVDEEKCNGCQVCVKQLACPAITWDSERKKAGIIAGDCTGCSVCAQVCPSGAIGPKR